MDARCRDLAQIEQVFRLSKTALLEMRPVYVRLESRTRGHALVVMPAYLLARRLADCWRGLDVTVEEGLSELKELCMTQVWVRGKPAFSTLPVPPGVESGAAVGRRSGVARGPAGTIRSEAGHPPETADSPPAPADAKSPGRHQQKREGEAVSLYFVGTSGASRERQLGKDPSGFAREDPRRCTPPGFAREDPRRCTPPGVTERLPGSLEEGLTESGDTAMP